MSASSFLCIGGRYNGEHRTEYEAGSKYFRFNRSTLWQAEGVPAAVLVAKALLRSNLEKLMQEPSIIEKAQKKSEKKKAKCEFCKHAKHSKDACMERICDAAGDMDYCPCGR